MVPKEDGRILLSKSRAGGVRQAVNYATLCPSPLIVRSSGHEGCYLCTVNVQLGQPGLVPVTPAQNWGDLLPSMKLPKNCARDRAHEVLQGFQILEPSAVFSREIFALWRLYPRVGKPDQSPVSHALSTFSSWLGLAATKPTHCWSCRKKRKNSSDCPLLALGTLTLHAMNT